jgi:DNA-binding winged helix-turn-helix (wHTH) protein
MLHRLHGLRIVRAGRTGVEFQLRTADVAQPAPLKTLRFANFEIDLVSGHLRKNGARIKLQEKPLQILVLLVACPGQVVSREELREKLWGEGTFVDFDHSLGTAIAKLRQALGDSAKSPRFVETVSNRGYRFLVPVENAVASRTIGRPSQIRRFGFAAAAGLLGSDVRKVLEWAAVATNPPAARSPAPVGWIAAGVLALALSVVSFLYFRQTPPVERVLRYTLAPPDNTTNIHSFAMSPDGRTVAIAVVVNGKRQLWLRPLDALQAKAMPGTEDATWPFWSPDSRNIGFFAQGKLKKIAGSGGPVQSLCEAPNGRGGSWNREDMLVFHPGGPPGVPIQRVSAAGGVPAGVTGTKGQSRFPVFLPDGRHFLYTIVLGPPELNGVYLSSLDGKENRRVLADASSVVFAAGRLLFVRQGNLNGPALRPREGTDHGRSIPRRGACFLHHFWWLRSGQCLGRRRAAV